MIPAVSLIRNYNLEDEQRSRGLQKFNDDLLRMIVEQNLRVTVEE